MKFSRDTIYAEHKQHIEKFAFDEKVVNVFPDMISRSVPGYKTIIRMIGLITKKYVQNNTILYDLGCSLGAASFAMHAAIKGKSCEIVAIDSSQDMLKKFQETIDKKKQLPPIHLVNKDINDAVIMNASIVCMNFTLQFITYSKRSTLIKKVCDGLHPNGVFILSEKLDTSTCSDKVLESLHYEFKKLNGYSELEISQKRRALEACLVPETLEQHKVRLIESGFSTVITWYQCFNFFSLLAIK